MSMSSNIDDREYGKFRDAGDKSKLAVVVEGGNPLNDKRYNRMSVEYPSETVEIYSYFLNLDLVLTVEVTYADCAKSKLINIGWI